MNIKKKISFFALFLISSFFIVSEVKGSSYSCTGNVCYGSSMASEQPKLTLRRMQQQRGIQMAFMHIG